jgi:uncharacterized membrane protein
MLLLVVVPGVIGACIFGYYAIVDWVALQSSYAHYQLAAVHSKDISVLFVAESDQNIHRINLFADGVWVLLSWILAAIGVQAIYRRK